nr:hypothetical protein [Candidatus Cloacimonadota bacterium]
MLKKILTLCFIISSIFLFSQSPPDTLWTRTYDQGEGRSVIEVESGGYITVGNEIESASYYMHYQKTDENGDILWSHTIFNDSFGHASYIEQLNPEVFLFTGTLSDHAVLLGLRDSGDAVGLGVFEDDDLSIGNSVAIADDNTFAIAAEGVEGYVIRTDGSGNQLWFCSYPDQSNIWGWIDNSSCMDIEFLNNGEIMISGDVEYPYVDEYWHDSYLIKADSEGNEIWYISFGGSYYTKFVVTDEEEFVMIVDYDNLVKISSEGELIWESDDLGFMITSIIKDSLSDDSCYFVAGHQYNDYNPHLAKIDDNGNIVWNHTYITGTTDNIYDLKRTSDEGFILTGSSNDHLYLIKLGQENAVDGEILPNKYSIHNSPNPF